MITALKEWEGDFNIRIVGNYYNIEEVPEEYRQYVEEIVEIKGISTYTFNYAKVIKGNYNDTLYVYMNNIDDTLRFEIRIYPHENDRELEKHIQVILLKK